MKGGLLLVVSALLLTCNNDVVESHAQEDARRFRIRANEERRRSDEWLERYHHQSGGTGKSVECLCDDINKPVSFKRTKPSTGIVLGFTGGATSKGESYNWTHIDAVAWASSPEIICRAHCHGAQTLVASPTIILKPYLNVTEWVQNASLLVQGHHADGLVFDHEAPLTRTEANIYVSLIRATKRAFRRRPHHHHRPWQVVTCVAWSPDGIDGRDNYPAVGLARASDYLYVMDYDTQSQIIAGPCMASANAPLAGMIRGMERYLHLGVPARKLILGVPWYGYRYPCLGEGTIKSDSRYCPIEQVPFRGVNCSDAVGTEIPYGKILQVYANMTPGEIKHSGGIQRDEYMDAAFLNNVDTNGTVHQFWFDDAKSMRDKFTWAKSMGLGGVGPYTFDDLDPTNFPLESNAMWSAFDAFSSFHSQSDTVLQYHS